jgi:hypothetical protein
MAHEPNLKEQSQDHTEADLAGERLPTAPGADQSRKAGYDTASSPEVILLHERLVSARDKRARHAAEQTAEKRVRHALVARLWYDASLESPRVAPSVRQHFTRCVEACLENECVKSYLADGRTGWCRESLQVGPVVRVEFEHALVLGQLSESFSIARQKAWGEFLGVRPLDPRDPIDPVRVVFVFKDSATYQKRFEQRVRLRRKLGKDYAPLVLRALRSGKGEFLAGLTEDESARIRARTELEPGRFWRAAKGREFITWPEPLRQLTLFDHDETPTGSDNAPLPAAR